MCTEKPSHLGLSVDRYLSIDTLGQYLNRRSTYSLLIVSWVPNDSQVSINTQCSATICQHLTDCQVSCWLSVNQMTIKCRSSVNQVSIDVLIKYRSSVIQGSIKGINRDVNEHLTAKTFRTHDPNLDSLWKPTKDPIGYPVKSQNHKIRDLTRFL